MNAIFGGVKLAPWARRGGSKPAAGTADQKRNRMIAAIHVAKKQLQLIDDDYRQIIFDHGGGKTSAGACTNDELAAVLKHFESICFRSTASGRARPADHPSAGKARALWISLGQLGAIDNPSEQALEAMARRVLKCDRLQWANQALVYGLIEALKAIAERHGWDQGLDGIAPANRVIVLKRRLIEAQMGKLRLAKWMPGDWDARRAAYAFGGVEVDSILGASLTELDSVAQALARAIADAKAARAIP